MGSITHEPEYDKSVKGDAIQWGQVSPNRTDIDDFFAAFVKKTRKHRGYMVYTDVLSGRLLNRELFIGEYLLRFITPYLQ